MFVHYIETYHKDLSLYKLCSLKKRGKKERKENIHCDLYNIWVRRRGEENKIIVSFFEINRSNKKYFELSCKK